eukprot:368517_1
METVTVTQNILDTLVDLFSTHQELFKDSKNNALQQSEFGTKFDKLVQEMDHNEHYASSLFCIYHHLRLKKWHIGCGTKYGAHFLLYPPHATDSSIRTRIHSKYLILHDLNVNNTLKLHSYIRLCKNIKKTLILTSFENADTTQINMHRESILNEEFMDKLKLNCVQCCIQN